MRWMNEMKGSFLSCLVLSCLLFFLPFLWLLWMAFRLVWFGLILGYFGSDLVLARMEFPFVVGRYLTLKGYLGVT